MSIKTVKEFFEKVAVEKSIQEEIKEVDKIRIDAFNDAANEIVKIAKSEGFEFSTEDFIEARKEAYVKETELGQIKSKSKKEKKDKWEECWLASGCGWGLWTPRPECGQGVAHIPPAQPIPKD